MSPGWFVASDLASGLLWTLTYALIVRRGFLDRTCGMPLLGLSAAITWELYYGVVHPTAGLPPFVVPVWLAVDALILGQYAWYGAAARRDAGMAAQVGFLVSLAAAVAGAFFLQRSLIIRCEDGDGVRSGFAVNVVMSLAFLGRLRTRRDVRGQSLHIALGKLLGSAVTIPHAHALHGSSGWLRVFMAVTLVGDVAYAALLGRRCRALGIRPWARL